MKYILAVILVSFFGVVFLLFPGGAGLQKILLLFLSGIVVTVSICRPVSASTIKLVAPLLIYIFFATYSSAVYFGSLKNILILSQPFVICIMVYYGFIFSGFKFKNLKHLRVLLIFVIFIQVIFALIKYNIIGIDEGFLIGTMSHNAGQLSFLVPAILAPIVIFSFSKRNLGLCILLISCLFIFGIINEKRSIVYLLPIICLVSFLVVNPGLLKARNLLNSVVMIVALVIGAAFGASLIPSLNPEESYNGSVSITHILNYAKEYLFMDYGGSLQGTYEDAKDDKGVQVGKLMLWVYIIEWIRGEDLNTFLFGVGFGALTPTTWIHKDSDLLFDLIGARGAMTGANLALLETGLFGLIILTAFFANVFRMIYKEYKKLPNSNEKQWIGMVLVIHLICCFDFYFYSITLFRTLPIPILYFGSLASVAYVSRWRKLNNLMKINRHNTTFIRDSYAGMGAK